MFRPTGPRPAGRRVRWPAAALVVAGLLGALPPHAAAVPLVTTQYARVSGDPGAAGIASRVAALVDEAAPRIAPLVGANDLRPIPVVVYVDSRQFRSATGLPQRSTVVGLAAFPTAVIHVDGTGRLASVEKVVPHEVAHIMIWRAMGPAFGELPLWMHEGVAEYAAGERASQVDPVTLEAVGRGESLPIADLDLALRGSDRPQALAYAEAASIVNFLVSAKGPGVIAELLAAAREQGDFPAAVKQVTGWSMQDLEAAWRVSVARRWRWPLLLQSPVLPFGLMLVIFIAGYLRYRRRRRRREQQQDQDW